MATPAAVLTILVRADTKAATAALGKTDKALKGTATQMDGVDKSSRRSQKSFAALKTGAYAAGGGVVLLGLAAKKAFREFEEAEKVTGQTRAALKSTGEAAKVTAREVENLAAKLSRKSGIDDEAIQSGENLLLTFTKIRNETGKGNDIFNRATTTILDMSVALGQDLKSSAIQVGKALNDPTKGMTALRRVGVAFTAEQEERVKGWVEEGKQLKAQKFILRELTTEFGGSAAAQATATGKLQVAWDNVFESIGKAFGPTLNKGMERLAGWLDRVGTILSNPKLTSEQKFNKIADMISKAVSDGLSKAGDAAAKAAPKVAGAFIDAFMGAGVWGKLAVGGTGAFLLKKLGLGGGIGKLLMGGGGRLGGGGGGLLGNKPVPVFVTNPGGAGGGGGKGPGGVIAKLPKAVGTTGRLIPVVAAGTVLAYVYSKVNKDLPTGGGAPERRAERGRPKPGVGLPGAAVPGGGLPTTKGVVGGKDESAAATAAGMEQLNKRLKVIRENIARMRDGSIADFGKIKTQAGKNFKDIADNIGLQTRKGKQAVADNFGAAAEAIARQTGRGKASSEKAMSSIHSLMKTHSAQGKQALVANLRNAAENVKLSMDKAGGATREGTALIRSLLIEAWTTMGFSKADAVALMSRTKGSAQTPMGGELRPNQRGSYISGGRPVGDSVPSVLERGEYVLNRNAVKKVGRQNLDRLNFKGAPRFQKGGMAGMVSAANQLERAQFPYVYGGGHSATPAPFGPMDCSGAVSYVLQHGGVNIPTMTSGSMMGIGQAGAGKVTLFANQGHVLMRIGDRFFGTSGSNPGGGAGWIDPAPDAGYLAGFTQRSFDPSGMAGGMFTGEVPKIPKVEASGPDGMVKGVVQGALNVTRKVAQAGINKVAAAMAPVGAGDPGDFTDFSGGAGAGHGKASRSQMVGWATKALHATGHGATPDAIEKILTLAMKESSWIVDSINLWDSNAAAGNPSGGLMHVTIDKVGGSRANLFDPVKNMIASINYQFGRYGGLIDFSPYKKGGPVGYAGDSLGVGTIKPLRGIFGDDRNVEGRVSGGKSPEWGLGALKDLGKKKAQYVFDFGSNKYGSVGIVQALRQANQWTGKQPLHTFTLNAGEVEANKKIRGMGGNISVIDWANKHGSLGDGLHGDYDHRARLVADSIERAAKATDKPNKPKPKGKVKHRKHLQGLQAPPLEMLNSTVGALMHGDQAERSNALHGLLDRIHGTGLPEHVTGRIERLTEDALIAGDYADRAGQLTFEDAAGNVIPGEIGGMSEIGFLQRQLDLLFALRNRLIDAQAAIEGRREQMRKLAELARKHLEFYADAIRKWGNVRRAQEKRLVELKKKPKKNKEQIKQVKALLDAIDADQTKRVRTRDNLKDRIIPALGGKRSGLAAYSADVLGAGLTDVQGVGSPAERMASLPAFGILGGSIFDVQLRLRDLKLPPAALTETATDTAAASDVLDITSERDELLKELGRLTLQRSAVEAIHEITLRDFPDFDRLGVPFGGKFHTGGVVPGPVGAERATVLQGGEGVFTRDQMAAMGTPSVTINVAPGMEWLKQFISVEVGRTNRVTARNAGRGLPGRGGGNLG